MYNAISDNQSIVYSYYITMAHTYEIEVKSLLGEKERADDLLMKLREKVPGLSLISKNDQLNHYFIKGNFEALKEKIIDLIPENKKETFLTIIERGTKVSVRTRDTEGNVLLVLKASMNDDSSSNAVSRIEWESSIGVYSLDVLDQVLIDCGFVYQAKWSREREEYLVNDMHVCIDKNAGYGYLAEFEKVIDDETTIDAARKEITDFMESLGVIELPQDRLERMFSYYNQHWADYYGTDKVFTIN